MNAGLRSYKFSCTFIVHYVFSRFRSLVLFLFSFLSVFFLTVSGIFMHSKRKDGALVIARVTAKS